MLKLLFIGDMLTRTGGERYVTEELKLKEKEIFSAEEKSLARELELFNQLVAAVLDESMTLSRTADALAELDVLAGWAVLAREWDYCRPQLDDDNHLQRLSAAGADLEGRGGAEVLALAPWAGQ